MEVNLGVNYHNRFDAVLTDAKTGKVKQVAKAENVVTDAFWNTFFRNATVSYITVGTGTGNVSVSDTTLFNRLATGYLGAPSTSNITILDGHSYSITRTITANESQWVGDLTEVGLCTNDPLGTLCTHALFTDSEGSPIVIHKTNADRLTITSTVYISIQYENPTNGIVLTLNKRSNINYLDPRPTYCPYDVVNLTDLAYPLFLYVRAESIMELNPAVTTLFLWSYQARQPSWGNTATPSYNNTTRTARLTRTTRTLSTEGNLTYPSTYLIKNLYSTVMQVMLPNATVYPARTYTLTAVANGTTTEFNFDIPILKTTGVKVYIDDVLQPASAYTFNGRNFKHPQAWDSADTLYFKKMSSFFGNFIRPSCVLGIGIEPGKLTSFYYDFESDYRVTSVGKYLRESITFNTCALYFSSDNENWQQLSLGKTTTEWKNLPNINVDGGIVSVTPTAARYWRVDLHINGGTNISSYYLESCLFFGDATPQLKFNTAPPANSTITIEAACEYPIKNENWVIETGMYLDYTVVRQ